MPFLLSDLMPRTETVLVGIHELIVEEMVIVQWERFVSTLTASIDVGSVVKPILNAITDANKGDADFLTMVNDNADEVGQLLETVVGQVLAKDIPLLATLGLLNQENVDRLKKADVAIESMDDLEKWIRHSLTRRQEPYVIEKVLGVNDFRDVLGKYLGLVTDMFQVAVAENPEPLKVAETPVVEDSTASA